MRVGVLLARGMLAGAVAGLLCFVFLKIAGEPQIERAIAFEAQLIEAAREPELVSRQVQAGIGLFTGVILYSTALGGLFALVFALAYRRIGELRIKETSALLAGLGAIALTITPNLKYPANPPSVGDPETIGARTALYFAMVFISIGAMVGAIMLRKRLLFKRDAYYASLVAAAAYLIAIATFGFLLPSFNEVPDGFPAAVLWQFRLASFESQLIMWAIIGITFGALAEQVANAELFRIRRADGRLE
ncbi:MAG TPA: CbtA family protein [Methylocella sp.]|nr:CbtA family protein [Methylocella sp.]